MTAGLNAHTGSSSQLGVYVHVPFCAAICAYCNFARGLLDPALLERYVDAVIEEILRNGSDAAADTIYFGGGTPSLLAPEHVERVVTACRRAFRLDPASEITLEVNPETVTPEGLSAFHEAGVNRLSIGVQSFRDEELQRLGRLHSAARARAVVEEARDAGFDNLSLDLMMWLPGQTREHWRASVADLVALGPDHASLYLLELYPNAPLQEEIARAGWSLAPDDDAADMYLEGLERLEAAGYEHYEISNVARREHRSRHNLKYWTDGEWVGFGAAAHSTRNRTRWRNVSGTLEYVERIEAGEHAASETRALGPKEGLEDALFTGLRLRDGLDLAQVRARHGVDVWERYGVALGPYAEAGLVERGAGRLRLTRRGMLLANEVMSLFV